jgi:multidrug efflux pump subunit AcrA (membrane-fusion protein)
VKDTPKDATAKAETPPEGTSKDAATKAERPKEGTKKEGQRMRPGISAKAEIHIETRTQTLFVPLQTVFAEDGVQYCYVHVPGGPPVKRKVQIGTSNDTYLEILDGLVEGEKVLLYNPMLPESGEAPKKDKKPDEPPPPAPGPKQGPGAPGGKGA